jgi:hypothetical protein
MFGDGHHFEIRVGAEYNRIIREGSSHKGEIKDHAFFQYSELRIDKILYATSNKWSDVATSTFIAEGSSFGFMLGYHWYTKLKGTESS